MIKIQILFHFASGVTVKSKTRIKVTYHKEGTFLVRLRYANRADEEPLHDLRNAMIESGELQCVGYCIGPNRAFAFGLGTLAHRPPIKGLRDTGKICSALEEILTTRLFMTG